MLKTDKNLQVAGVMHTTVCTRELKSPLVAMKCKAIPRCF